jgi:hydantoinase/carbamoylase family amidase
VSRSASVSLRVNSPRLLKCQEELGQIGRDADGGITRVCLTSTERAAHDLVAGWMSDAGLVVERDAFGNTVGTRRGRSGGRAIAIGSHVDSVPRGGNYDGVAGVIAAVEVIRALDDADIQTQHDLKVLCFTAEEAARFAAPSLGSKAAIGLLSPTDLHDLRDVDGVTLHEALSDNGLDPAGALRPAPWVDDVDVFLEMHIEQGRVLESAGEEIGVVDWVAGNRRVRMSLLGQTDHSGATPMRLRRDALAAAAELVLEVERLAMRSRELVGTVGEFDVRPGAMTAVPGEVDLSVDVRSTDVVLQERTMMAVIAAAEARALRREIQVRVDDMSSVAPILLPTWLSRQLSEVGTRVAGRARIMTSGAGHDAAILARRVVAGMIFIPCRRGISHSPEEWVSPDHIATGARVLAESVLAVDDSMAAFSDAAAARTATLPANAGREEVL